MTASDHLKRLESSRLFQRRERSTARTRQLARQRAYCYVNEPKAYAWVIETDSSSEDFYDELLP